MKLTAIIMTLTTLGSLLTVAWAAGIGPGSFAIETWWNIGLLLGAALVVTAARAGRRT